MSQIDILSNLFLDEELLFFIPKVFLAIFCGGLIGIERGVKNSVAGLRTNILICVGSAIFTALAVYTCFRIRTFQPFSQGGLGAFGDPLRLWGQIITGIGFIGAGVIFKPKSFNGEESPRGVTTAAYIWINCAIGMLIGAGASILAIILTIGMVIMLILIELLEEHIFKGAKKIIPKRIHDEGNYSKPIQELMDSKKNQFDND